MAADLFSGILPPVVMEFIVPACFVGGISIYLLYMFLKRFGYDIFG